MAHRSSGKVALSARPEQLLPADERKDPFKDLRKRYQARNADPDHPANTSKEGVYTYVTDDMLEQKLVELDEEKRDRSRKLKIVARFTRDLLGIDKGLEAKDFDVCLGRISGDGKRAVLQHAKPAREALLNKYDPSMRATDAFDPPPGETIWLAVFAMPITTQRPDGSFETKKRPLHMPLDIIEAIEQGWFTVDIEDQGLFYMTPDRESYQRMVDRTKANVAFFLNQKAGSDRSRKYVGKHPLSGKVVFAPHIPEEAVNKPKTKKEDLIRIGVAVTERLTWYQVRDNQGTTADGGLIEYPEKISDEEWEQRERDLILNAYRTDAALEERREWKPYYVRIGPWVFDTRDLFGLSKDELVTSESLLGCKAVEKGELTRGGKAHAREVVTGQKVLVGRHCREVVDDGDVWLDEEVKGDTNAKRLFDMAMAALETLVEKTEAKEKAKAEAEAAKKAKKAKKKPPSRAKRNPTEDKDASEDSGQEGDGDETGDTTDDGDKGASEDDTSDDDASDPEGSDDTSGGDVSSGEPAEAAADADA